MDSSALVGFHSGNSGTRFIRLEKARNTAGDERESEFFLLFSLSSLFFLLFSFFFLLSILGFYSLGHAPGIAKKRHLRNASVFLLVLV